MKKVELVVVIRWQRKCDRTHNTSMDVSKSFP